MTTTQSLSSQGLTANVEEDIMQMTTSPYIEIDDIEVDLEDDEDDLERSIEDNSMIDDATETAVSMQQDSSAFDYGVGAYEATAEEDLVDFEDDYDMNQDDQSLSKDNALADEEVADPGIAPQTQMFSPQPAPIAVENYDLEPGAADEGQMRVEQKIEGEANEEEEATNTVETDPDAPSDYALDEPVQSVTNPARPASTNNRALPEVRDHTQHTSLEGVPDAEQAQQTEYPAAEAGDESEPHQAPSEQTHTGPEANRLSQADQENDETIITARPFDEDEGEDITSKEPESVPLHLHPVIIDYQGDDYSLFPPEDPDDGTTYLLRDSALASQSLETLLSACRDLMADNLHHDDEMVIDIPTLGLHICQDSKYAAQLTLAQVIDTYMLLSQNERLSVIEPLYCRLSHRVCLQTQMAYLLNSAREGKSYTAVAEEHIGSPDEEQNSQDHADDTTYYETADVFDKQESFNNTSVEIEDSEQDVSYQPEADDDVEQGIVDSAAHIAKKSSPTENDGASAETKPAVAQDSEAVLQEEKVTEAYGVADGNDDAASQSSQTVEGDIIATIPLGFAENNGTVAEGQAAAPLQHYDIEEEEDLFADDDDPLAEIMVPADTTNDRHAVISIQEQNGDIPANTDDEIIVWDNEDDQQDTADVVALPVTPSRPVNGKRKLDDEEDDFIDLEDTPGAKRPRSS